MWFRFDPGTLLCVYGTIHTVAAALCGYNCILYFTHVLGFQLTIIFHSIPLQRTVLTTVLFLCNQGGVPILQLDDKKIRKGKPIGLPYVGSKKKVSKKIVEIIKQNFGSDIPVYDVFGGGGAIAAELLLNDMRVHYNDLDSDVTNMFVRVISQDRKWLKALIVSRDEFLTIRDKKEKTVDDNLKLLVNSFANNSKRYLYNKEQSNEKYNLAIEIIKKHDVFSGYRQTEIYRNAKQPGRPKQILRLTQLERLAQLERLQQLGQLQQTQKLKPTNYNYTAFSNVKNAILYLDPPYQNTKNDYKFELDYQLLYDWCVEMSKRNIVIISGYNIPDPRFKVVWEFKTARGTYAGGVNKRYEKLYMVSEGR